MHNNLTGFKTVLQQRGGNLSNPNMIKAFDTACASCHASCGQCHVSRPTYTGGGLLSGHTFKKVASQDDTCTACHGARIGSDYYGEIAGSPGDVHYMKGGMPCIKCHTEAEFHGSVATGMTRYTSSGGPTCLGCHPEAAPGKSDIAQHNIHGGKIECQVCHSASSYKGCTNCHAGVDDKGLPYRTTDPTVLDFKIGLNPQETPGQPYDYVLLRQAPATKDMLGYFGSNLLPNFDAVPTWKYTTPHNIQRQTTQNASCNSCHGHPELFLNQSDLGPGSSAADQKLIVPTIPKKQ
jgi:thiosulfate/3-mercaptopyruvate sulfurtransferase